MTESPGHVRVDPTKTWIPVATVVAMLGAAIMFVWSLAGYKATLVKNTEAIEELTEAVDDMWTARDMERWVQMIRILNPTLKLPDNVK